MNHAGDPWDVAAPASELHQPTASSCEPPATGALKYFCLSFVHASSVRLTDTI